MADAQGQLTAFVTEHGTTNGVKRAGLTVDVRA
jgi:hypothetical protein